MKRGRLLNYELLEVRSLIIFTFASPEYLAYSRPGNVGKCKNEFNEAKNLES